MLKTGPRVSRGFLYVSYPPRIELWTLDENSKKENERKCVKAVLYIVILEYSLYSKLSYCIRFIHITMRHVMSGFHFVPADFQTWIPWYSTHWTIQSMQGSFAFILPLLLISLVWGLRCLRSEYKIISSDFFFSKKLPFPVAMKYIFFHLPWFISEKLGLGAY